MVEDEDEVIASFASISTFSFPGMPVCEGTHMNSITLWVDVMMLCIWKIISLEGFGASMARRALRESLIIKILFDTVDFPNIMASLIAWVSAVNMLASGRSLNRFEEWLVE